jgi:hypothetical protein
MNPKKAKRVMEVAIAIVVENNLNDMVYEVKRMMKEIQ